MSDKIKDITYILRDLLKVIKVVSLYPETNPLPQSLKQSFSEKLVSLVEEHGEIGITVGKDYLALAGETVFQDRSKEENLAAIFFETGITDFTFKAGLEVDDIYSLLDAIRVYLNAPNRTQDLATLIWEAGVSGFSFGTLEDVALSDYDGRFDVQARETDILTSAENAIQMASDALVDYQSIFVQTSHVDEASLDDSGDTPQAGSVGGAGSKGGKFYARIPGQVPPTVLDQGASDGVALRSSEAAEAMGLSDLGSGPSLPDTTLILNDEFKLSEQEEREVARLILEDAEFDVYESIGELLREMLLQESSMDAFYETVTLCEQVVSQFVSHGKLFQAGRVISFWKELESRIRDDRPLWSERLKEACLTAGSRDRLKHLAKSLNDHESLGVDELRRYLENFGWEALAGIADLLGQMEHQRHRETLVEYLITQGRDNIDIVSNGIYDKRWYVVRNSVVILARVGGPKALTRLAKIVGHNDERVRMELTHALKDCPDTEALNILERLALDPISSVRSEAVKAIVERRGQPAFDAITRLINDDRFATIDFAEQESLLNAFSILGGDMAVGFLEKLVVRYNLWRSSSIDFYRKAAMQALSKNPGERAERLLVRLSGSWRPDIKRQAQEALRLRRESLYGGE
ncbi:MAG: HEAT repeat domain-containing protein [Candidatus Zixiibacteriota bacterium]